MVKSVPCRKLTLTSCKLRKYSSRCKSTFRRNKGKRGKGRKSYCRKRKNKYPKTRKKARRRRRSLRLKRRRRSKNH